MVIRHWPLTLTRWNDWLACGFPRLRWAPTYWPVPLNDARTVPVTSTKACVASWVTMVGELT